MSLTRHQKMCAFTVALLAAAQTWALEPKRQDSVDLDGDGKKEQVTLEPGTEGHFSVRVGSTVYKGRVQTNEAQGFTVVDVDASEPRKELLVHTTGELDDQHRVVFLRFDGKRLFELGTLQEATEVKGNGIVLEDTWDSFWKRREKYVLDPKTQKLTQVRQELLYVGIEGTVRGKRFPLQRTRTDTTPVANVAPGSKVLVVAAATPDKDGLVEWYLLKTSTGLLGWARIQTLVDEVELPFAG
ncbi:hypothetical protein F0U61_45260 [Archangium violaceum]|uniref:hypothetical protein n=1 Tax=Archangium violaceum TaxID=83451 RepID=UPI002B2DF0FE|nr:hypothetical protein F0U61_45260 [Archangium violaceum]